MEIVLTYVIGGMALMYLALIVIEKSDQIRHEQREREIIKQIVKEGRY